MLHQNVAYPDASSAMDFLSGCRQDLRRGCRRGCDHCRQVHRKYHGSHPTRLQLLPLRCRESCCLRTPITSASSSTPTSAPCCRLSETLPRAGEAKDPRSRTKIWPASLPIASTPHSNRDPPINVRSAALQEDGALPMSLASPPFPDVFRLSSVNMPTVFDVNASDTYSLPADNLETFDRIFAWTDETTGVDSDCRSEEILFFSLRCASFSEDLLSTAKNSMGHGNIYSQYSCVLSV